MALLTVEQWKKSILNRFVEGVSNVVLFGDPGTGKTWMAKHIHDVVVKEDNFYASFWLSLNRKHEKLSVYQHIACQLSLFSIPQECEEDHDQKENAADDLEKLRKKISEELERRRQQGKYLLLVLDDEGNRMNEEQIMVEFELKRLLNPHRHLKLLISRRAKLRYSSHDTSGSMEEQIIGTDDSTEYMEFKGIHTQDLNRLFQENLSKDIKTKISSLGSLSEAVIGKSKNLPAAIVLVAGVLNYIHGTVRKGRSIARNHSGCWKLEGVLEEIGCEEQADEVIPVIRFSYGILADTTLIGCFWHSWLLFEKCGAVHFNELISNWILEGYFGSVDCLEVLYHKAHSALMELMDFGVLKMEEDNFIVPERAILGCVDTSLHKICRSANLGLPHVLNDWKGLGRTVLKDGTVKTVPNSLQDKMLSTLLIDGRFAKDEMLSPLLESAGKLDELFQRIQKLHVLAIFKLQRFSFSELETPNVNVLVLNGCTLLREDFEHIKTLESLHVLEISDAATLGEIPDDLFEEGSKLRSLNLSATGIKTLPQSMSNLTQLKRLILRQSKVEVLPSLVTLQNLEVLDLSGSSSLHEIVDATFSNLERLQVIDFSQTNISKVPIVKDLKELTHLVLKRCARINGLGLLDQLSNLQVLDLSEATSLKFMDPGSFKSIKKLKVLDLSQTKIKSLHPSLKDLCLVNLKLRNCAEIGKLPPIAGLTGLECLDLSGASKLEELKDESFGRLKCLRHLNLSTTKLKKLPSLENLENLTDLILRDCKVLVKFPELSGLKRLEVLDFSGCEMLTNPAEVSFEHMSRLQTLHLSGTKITSVPRLHQQSKLLHLYLSNCSELENLPELRSLTSLEVLDLSDSKSVVVKSAEFLNHTTKLQILKLPKLTPTEFSAISRLNKIEELSLKDFSGEKTRLDLEALEKLRVLELSGEAVESLSSLDKLTNLQKLILNGCSSLSTLPSLESQINLEVLDISGTQIQQLPLGISELSLKQLHVPDLKIIQNFGWGKMKQLPEDLKFDFCDTSDPSSLFENSKKPSIVVRGTKFFETSKSNSKLQDVANHLLKHSVMSLCSSEAKVQAGDTCQHDDLSDKFVFNDIRYQTRYFPHKENDGPSIEIREYGRFPADIKEFVERAEYISLVENAFIRQLSDLYPYELTDMKLKGCWIERCVEMSSIFLEEKDLQMGKHMETLWLSNLPSLVSFYSEGIQLVTFNNLSHLHLDCCPKLRHVFRTHDVPKNLQILQIRFCDNLETVFEHEETSEVRVISCKLHTLLLLGLPELKTIGVKFPPIREPKVWRCPKLDVSEEDLRSGVSGLSSSEISGPSSC